MDEQGIIKFNCFHELVKLDKSAELSDLIHFRNLAFRKSYIGVYPNGIGYGNISLRLAHEFLISGSATGMIETAGEEHFSLVTKWESQNNQLWCKGPIKASSESLTHGLIYNALPKVNAILHIHSAELWKKHYDILPSTSRDVEYGTPEMANAVSDLVKAENFKEKGVFLMQGHQDGMVAFGKSLREIISIIDNI